MEIKITKIMYSWTKYGGGRKALVTQDREEFNYCQCCGEKIPYDFPMFKYEILEGEYIRLCPNCWIVARVIPKDFDKVKKLITSDKEC
jgi:hypothetical protein